MSKNQKILKNLKKTISKNIDRAKKKVADESGFDGKSWRKRKGVHKHKILVKTGRLKNSIKAKVTSNGIKLYSNSPYAKRHNDGLDVCPKGSFLGKIKPF